MTTPEKFKEFNQAKEPMHILLEELSFACVARAARRASGMPLIPHGGVGQAAMFGMI